MKKFMVVVQEKYVTGTDVSIDGAEDGKKFFLDGSMVVSIVEAEDGMSAIESIAKDFCKRKILSAYELVDGEEIKLSRKNRIGEEA